MEVYKFENLGLRYTEAGSPFYQMMMTDGKRYVCYESNEPVSEERIAKFKVEAEQILSDGSL